MSVKKRLRRGKALRGIWLCALMLTVLTVLTTPFAVSKYTTRGTGAAKARIAAFDPVWEYEPTGSSLTAAQFGSGFVNPGANKQIRWKITNKSEVMIYCEVFPKVTDAPSLKLDKDRTTPAHPHASGVVGEYTSTGGRVDFNTVAGAGTVTASTTGITTTALNSWTLTALAPKAPSAGSPPLQGLPPNATTAQQEFRFTFSGATLPNPLQLNFTMTTGTNPPNTFTRDAVTNNDFKAYRVNFDSDATQVD